MEQIRLNATTLNSYLVYLESPPSHLHRCCDWNRWKNRNITWQVTLLHFSFCHVSEPTPEYQHLTSQTEFSQHNTELLRLSVKCCHRPFLWWACRHTRIVFEKIAGQVNSLKMLHFWLVILCCSWPPVKVCIGCVCVNQWISVLPPPQSEPTEPSQFCDRGQIWLHHFVHFLQPRPEKQLIGFVLSSSQTH